MNAPQLSTSVLTDSQRAALTARLRRGRAVTPDGISRRDPCLSPVPASFGQEQLWFIDRFAPGQAMYNIPIAISVRGPLDPDALDRAVTALAARHEVLRTRLVTGAEGRPVQVIDPPAPVPVVRVDLADQPGDGSGGPGATAGRAGRLGEYLDAAALLPFQLATGPLWRVSLIRLGGGEHVVLAIFHHAIFDGWSAGVLVRELAALYQEQATGSPGELGPLPIQFGDYAAWERERLHGPALAELEQYWYGALAGCPTVRFPADRPRPVTDDPAGGLAEHLAGPDLLEELRQLNRLHNYRQSRQYLLPLRLYLLQQYRRRLLLHQDLSYLNHS